MISFDTYQYDVPAKSDWFVKNTGFQLGLIDEIATEKNKLKFYKQENTLFEQDVAKEKLYGY